MTREEFLKTAKKYNAQIRKEIKILQSGVTEKPKPKNFYKKLQKQLETLNQNAQ